jgi:hypothetical protein
VHASLLDSVITFSSLRTYAFGCVNVPNSTAQQTNGWVIALLVVKFDEKHGQQIQSIYPANVLPHSMLTDLLKMLSMPDCIEPG